MRQQLGQRHAGVGVLWSGTSSAAFPQSPPRHDPARGLQSELFARPGTSDRSRGSCSLLDGAMGLRKGGPGRRAGGRGEDPKLVAEEEGGASPKDPAVVVVLLGWCRPAPCKRHARPESQDSRKRYVFWSDGAKPKSSETWQKSTFPCRSHGPSRSTPGQPLRLSEEFGLNVPNLVLPHAAPPSSPTTTGRTTTRRGFIPDAVLQSCQ